jgi:hypothetical protein
MRAALMRFPTRNGDVSATDGLKDLLNMPIWVPDLFGREVERVHDEPASRAADP